MGEGQPWDTRPFDPMADPYVKPRAQQPQPLAPPAWLGRVLLISLAITMTALAAIVARLAASEVGTSPSLPTPPLSSTAPATTSSPASSGIASFAGFDRAAAALETQTALLMPTPTATPPPATPWPTPDQTVWCPEPMSVLPTPAVGSVCLMPPIAPPTPTPIQECPTLPGKPCVWTGSAVRRAAMPSPPGTGG